MKPQRIQLQRTRGWKLPSNTVMVARPGRWGNPYRVGATAHWEGADVAIPDAAAAVALYRRWMEHHLRKDPRTMQKALAELRGKNLACWCKTGAPCHADVLLELANGAQP